MYKNVTTPIATFNLYGPDGKRLGVYTFSGVSGGWSTVTAGQFTNFLYLGSKALSYSEHRIGSNGKYYPYGTPYTSTGTESQAFGTYVNDESGLLYADQRYYDPGFGRFMTADQSNANIDYRNPISWNRYGYANGDPVNGMDPTGQYCDDDSGCGDGGDDGGDDGGRGGGGGGGGGGGNDGPSTPGFNQPGSTTNGSVPPLGGDTDPTPPIDDNGQLPPIYGPDNGLPPVDLPPPDNGLAPNPPVIDPPNPWAVLLSMILFPPTVPNDESVWLRTGHLPAHGGTFENDPCYLQYLDDTVACGEHLTDDLHYEQCMQTAWLNYHRCKNGQPSVHVPIRRTP